MSDDALRGEFIAESHEHLDACEACLLRLAAGEAAGDAVQACFRALHTIKGTAGFFGLDRIQALAHVAEQVLDDIRSDRLACGADQCDALLAAVSRLRELVQAAERGAEAPDGDDAIATALRAASGHGGDASDTHAAAAPTHAAAKAEPAAHAASAPAAPRSPSAPASAPIDAARGLDTAMARLMAASPSDAAAMAAAVAAIAALADEQRWPESAVALVAEARAALAGPDAYGAVLGALSRLYATPAPPPAAAAAAAITAEVVADCVAEIGDLAAEAERALLAPEATAERIGAMFRAFHTIKGIAAYVVLPRFEALAHAIESELAPARDGAAPLGARQRQLALAGVDATRGLLEQLRANGRDAGPWPRLADDLARLVGDPPQVEGDAPSASAAASTAVAPAAASTDAASATPAVAAATASPVAGEPARPEARDAAARGDSFARVPIGRLDELVDLVGELIIAQAMIAHHPQLADRPQLAEAVGRQARILADLQGLSLSLRMVPVRATFQKMARVAHDTARKLGKQVELRLVGEDTEIDRTLAEVIADPLMHMVRNALDHGIEAPAARAAAGKPAKGVLTLSAHQTSDSVVIRMTDDGKGMDPARLVAKAREKGLVRPDQQPSRAEALALIFAAGFSTAEQVTAVSGRGVGMDVVKRNVDRVNGQIEIASEVGAGSTFSIRLPLTTAILDAMLLRVGAQRFLIPVTAVVEAVRPRAGEVRSVLATGRVIESRGRLLPVARLADLFATQGTAAASGDEGVLLVIDGHGGGYALQIDEILGQQQVVIKPLDDQFPHHRGLAGSAILGDGRVGLILDPANLLKDAA